MLKKIAVGVGLLKALEWVVNRLSNGISINPLPIQRGDVKLFKESLLLRLQVTNQTALPLNITSVVGVVSQGSQPLKRINMLDVIKVNPRTTKTLVFEMHLDLDTTLMNLADALSNNSALTPIYFKGTVKANGLSLPINRSFEFLKTA